MPTTLKDVFAFLATCSKEDRRAVVQEINFLVDAANATAKAELKVGDKVEFRPGKRNMPSVIRGEVREKRVKRIVVRPDNGGRDWIVPASALTKVG